MQLTHVEPTVFFFACWLKVLNKKTKFGFTATTLFMNRAVGAFSHVSNFRRS